MRWLFPLCRNFKPRPAEKFFGWQRVVSCLCALSMLLSTPALQPASDMLMSGLQTETEEDVETGEDTEFEGMEERHLSAPCPRFRQVPHSRQVSAGLALRQRAIADRSEYRQLNGTGAPLRC